MRRTRDTKRYSVIRRLGGDSSPAFVTRCGEEDDMKQQTLARLLLATALVAIATAMRVIPHPWNLTPIGAVALFSGSSFDRKRWSFAVPLVSLFLSDIVIGFHSLIPVIYATFAASVLIGMLIKRVTPASVIAGAFAS